MTGTSPVNHWIARYAPDAPMFADASVEYVKTIRRVRGKKFIHDLFVMFEHLPDFLLLTSDEDLAALRVDFADAVSAVGGLGQADEVRSMLTLRELYGRTLTVYTDSFGYIVSYYFDRLGAAMLPSEFFQVIRGALEHLDVVSANGEAGRKARDLLSHTPALISDFLCRFPEMVVVPLFGPFHSLWYSLRHFDAIRRSGHSLSDLRTESARAWSLFGDAVREYANPFGERPPSAYPAMYEFGLWARGMTHSELTPAAKGEVYEESNRLILHLHNINEYSTGVSDRTKTSFKRIFSRILNLMAAHDYVVQCKAATALEQLKHAVEEAREETPRRRRVDQLLGRCESILNEPLNIRRRV